MNGNPAARPLGANAEPARTDTATTWAHALDFWMGRPQTGAARATEQMMQICHDMLEANRTAADMIWDAARRQQELAFTTARTALSASSSPTINGTSGEAWRQIAEATREVGDRSREAVKSLADAALAAQRCTLAVAAAATAPGGLLKSTATRQP